MVLLERFDPHEALDAIERHGVTIVYGSATMFHRLLDAAGARAAEVFRSVRYVKAGAMLVGGDLPERWSRRRPRRAHWCSDMSDRGEPRRRTTRRPRAAWNRRNPLPARTLAVFAG